MFLKSIDIYGFKSFAEKVSITFSGGISAIIGPNGCGKSNIIDAIRWTLGEQSIKTLRGGRMEDIIFSGSEKRKPLNFAEVTLVFGDAGSTVNLEYDELSITRRIYRSGESEYMINKTACRLKDVTELFMDTGIGKEVYSIVGQNRVEEIISARPEERRELIEEAAGILKYKHRKKEARKRLEDMRSNLQRITDLVYEMENQIEPLEGQAEIARHYKKLKEEIKSHEEIILKHRIAVNEEKISKVKHKLDSVRDESFKVVNSLNNASEKLDEIRKKIDKMNSEKETLERTLNSYMRDKEQLEGSKRLLEEKEHNLKTQIEENLKAINKLQEREKNIHENIKSNKELLNKKEKKMVDIKIMIEDMRAREKILNSDNSLQLTEKIQEELTAATGDNKVLDSELFSAQKELSVIKDKSQEYENQLKDYKDKLHKNNLTISELSNNKKMTEEKLVGIEKEIGKQNLLQENTSADINRLQQKSMSVKEKLHSSENKLWLLKKTEAEKDPLQSGSAELLKNKESNFNGIICSLLSVIDIPKKFLSAIETALGDKYFGVIASDNKAAIEALQHLKENEKGWTNLFPMESIKAVKENNYKEIEDSSFKEIPGYIDKALNLIKINPSYKFIGEVFLGNVFICQDLQSALKVAESANYSVYAVTLQGEAVYPKGIIRGGKDVKSRLISWNREEEIKELTPIVNDYKREQEELDKELERLESLGKKLNIQFGELKREEEKLKKEVDLITRHIYIAENEKEHILKAIKEETLLIEKSLKAREDKENEISNLIEKVGNSKKRTDAISGKLEDLKKKNHHLLKEREVNLENINMQEIELNILKEQISNIMSQSKQFDTELLDVKNSIEAIENKNSEINKTLEEIVTSKNNDLAELEKLAEESRDNSIAFEKKKNEQADAEAVKTELEKEEQDIKNKRNRLERNEHRLELELTRLSAEIKHQSDLFSDKFGDIPSSWAVKEDFNELQTIEEIDKLKKEIENMGHVRVGAIDELNRLNDRVNFLKEQEEDLKNGEKSLIDILEEIDERISEQFISAADEIKKNFSESFSDIFGGGNAMIRFTDEDKILESGIEIEVQPPGKNLKNISLLSSGEKALTAIAFIFAIFKYKPAPFYFLDEIESSLDDSNLTRFIDYLEKGAFNSQFILITHRRKTMEKAGIVYGVTMPESGISKVVSIKLGKKAS